MNAKSIGCIEFAWFITSAFHVAKVHQPLNRSNNFPFHTPLHLSLNYTFSSSETVGLKRTDSHDDTMTATLNSLLAPYRIIAFTPAIVFLLILYFKSSFILK